ncbi:hypothetical protein TYRP_013983 [Tyrophagus putrescentiae]|nr:hypothetical protein TYRP_013983 [Tyrophagus putrescentiae]
MDNDSSLDFTLSPSFHTARFDSTNYRTCNTRFTNFQTVIFNTTEQLDESDGHSSFKDIVTDFADPESGVFWGAVTETEKQRRNFQAENSSTLMAPGESHGEVSQDQSHQLTAVCKKDSGIDSMDQCTPVTLVTPVTPVPEPPKPRSKMRLSINRFGFDMKNRVKGGSRRPSIRRTSIKSNHYLRAPKTPKWDIKPMHSSTPFPKY